jgi:hypothetical protein
VKRIAFGEVSKRKTFFEIFDDVEGSRADFGVFQSQIGDLNEFFSIGVWVFPASFGSRFVDEAGIVIPQKRTGGLFENHEIIFISSQILTHKLGLLQLEEPSDPTDVLVRENRTRRFAAVAATKAICLGEFFLVKLLYNKVKTLSGLFLELVEILFAFGSFFQSFLRKILQ